MKVKDLIARLQKCDPELEVQTEGCDCNGDTGFVALFPADEAYPTDVVMICRSDSQFSADFKLVRVEP